MLTLSVLISIHPSSYKPCIFSLSMSKVATKDICMITAPAMSYAMTRINASDFLLLAADEEEWEEWELLESKMSRDEIMNLSPDADKRKSAGLGRMYQAVTDMVPTLTLPQGAPDLLRDVHKNIKSKMMR